jgi:uncharacterized membrane protein
MHWVTNVVLQIFFFVVFVIIAALFADKGHGTYAPYAIFFGPFSAPFFLIALLFTPLLGGGQSGDFLLLLIMLLFLLSLLQPVVYGLLWEKFFRKISIKKSSTTLPIVHLAGALPGLLFCAVEDFNRIEFTTMALSYTISFALIGIYWYVFFREVSRKE